MSGLCPRRRIRAGKDCGIGHFPSESFAINSAWLAASLIAATLLAWLKLLALDGDLAKAEPKTLRQDPARRGAAGPRRAPAPPADRGGLAVGGGDRRRMGRDQRPAAGPVSRAKTSLRSRKEPWGPWNPRPPGPPAGPLSYPDPKIKIDNAPQRVPATKTGPV